MPIRTWCYVAALGLTLTSVGQAQEQADPGQDRTDAEEPEAGEPPFAIPVQIIEDEEAAEARERSEAEAREREIDDLAAQQGMDEATRAMNEATQRMAFYSLIGTITVVIGTALLFWTLMLTRQANQAARYAVVVTREIGQAQTRAYLTIDVQYFSWGANTTARGRPRIGGEFHNAGMTPAVGVEYEGRCSIESEKDGVGFSSNFFIPPALPRTFNLDGLGRQQLTLLSKEELTESMVAWLETGRAHIAIEIEYSYRDVFKDPETSVHAGRWAFQSVELSPDDHTYRMVRIA